MMASRDLAREVARNSQLDIDWDSYRRLRNQCTTLQKEDRKKYYKNMYNKMEEENDSRAIYGLTKQLLGWKTSQPPVRLVKGGRVATKQNDIANMQAEHYQNKVKEIKENLPKVRMDPLKLLREAFAQWRPPGRIPKFEVRNVTEKEVIEMLTNHKKSHAFGNDLLDASALIIGKDIIARPLAWVINLSLGTGRFITQWKVARIIPLLKSKDSDQTNPGSFRPVSQLSIISKLAERVVQRQLLEHMEMTKQISGDHHAYRRFTSTTTALLQIVDCISRGIDHNKIVATMSIDLSAAFDCVEHRILIDKLKFYNIGDRTLRWIQSYLTGRTSHVVIGSGKSEPYEMLHGVPQGSVLGPVLYLLYVNEYSMTTKDENCRNEAHENNEKLFGEHCESCGTMTIFADDSQYVKWSGSRIENQRKITENFHRIVHFLNSAGLEVNQGKTSLTEYMARQKRWRVNGDPPELKVEILENNKITEKTIKNKEYCRTLGGNIKNDLSWDMHLSSGKNALLPAIRRQLGALNSLKFVLSKKAKLQLVNGFIISKINYIICLWGNTTPNQRKKVQICLNSAARFVLDAKRTEKQSNLMKNCNWLTVDERTELQSLTQFWKVLRWDAPEYFADRIHLENDDLASTANPRLLLTANAWRCKSTLNWNRLPETLRSELRFSKFKSGLKRFMIERREELNEFG